ncbi:hypothetical protein [uncultured Winogradskyella sp.]|uniref:CdaR family protein n=1 Tax=uncultured Winogradskyella sp. TaxID=395353 RepID=UPI00262A83A0|nr:hypothetical protein [uncultured Winogradskyella sp.]
MIKQNSNKALKNLKKRDLKRFGIFISIAFVFLIISKLSNDYKQDLKLHISLVNLDDEIILINDSLNTLDAIIEAKGFTLLRFLFNNKHTIYLDSKKDVLQQRHGFNLSVQKTKYLIEDQLGTTIDILSIKPDTLVLPYSMSASKYVPLVLKSKVNFATGYDVLDKYKLNSDSVKVVGAIEDIKQIGVLYTQPLNLQDVKTDINEELSIEVPSAIKVYPEKVTVFGEVKRFTEGKMEVPITIINKPSSVAINYFPKTVMLSYYVNLEDYNKIKHTDFVVQCNYAQSKTNLDFLVPEIVKKPNFVKRVSIKQKRIDFIKL